MPRAEASLPQHLSKRQRKLVRRNLVDAGYDSYGEYLRSEEWYETRERYRESGLPQTCVVCFDPNVDLHHKSYIRLSREHLDDLVPLCRHHHEELHERKLDLWRGPSVLRAEKCGGSGRGARLTAR